MSLFVSSHYKNSPNDLQLLADAPGHAILVLLKKNINKNDPLPDVYCAI
jgi:N-acetyltransferase 10